MADCSSLWNAAARAGGHGRAVGSWRGADPPSPRRREHAKLAHPSRPGRSSSEGALKRSTDGRQTTARMTAAAATSVNSKRPSRPFAMSRETRPLQPGGGAVGPSTRRETVASSGSSLNQSATRVDSSIREREIYEEVSSLVEELETVRARALASGGRPPRAVEAAASALDPLLRLRDVTGAFACDLTLMPWLPQLLAVFRNVLHTAVDGVGTPRNHPGAGAGCVGAESAEGVMAFATLLEIESLRQKVQHQEATIREFRQRERHMVKELEELRVERDELQNRVWDLESLSATTAPSGSSSTPRSSCASNVPEMDQQWLARRVHDLERENTVFLLERKAAEEQIHDLVTLARGALEDQWQPPTKTIGCQPSPERQSVACRRANTPRRQQVLQSSRTPGSRTPRVRHPGVCADM